MKHEISKNGKFIEDGVLQTISLVRDLLDEIECEVYTDET